MTGCQATPIPALAINCYRWDKRGVCNETLSVRICENIIRLRGGLSRGALGRKLTPPVPRQTIEKLETGQIPLTVEWIEKLAVALDADPAELVAGELGQFTLSEQVADETARALVRIGLPGAQPSSSNLQVLALLLGELVEMFSRHPATRTDLQALRPAIGFLERQFGRRS